MDKEKSIYIPLKELKTAIFPSTKIALKGGDITYTKSLERKYGLKGIDIIATQLRTLLTPEWEIRKNFPGYGGVKVKGVSIDEENGKATYLLLENDKVVKIEELLNRKAERKTSFISSLIRFLFKK